MRQGQRNPPTKYINKVSISSNVSPTKNFFSQHSSSSLIKALIAADSTPNKVEIAQEQQSKSPLEKHNTHYQRYMVPSSVNKQRQIQTDSKKSKSYVGIASSYNDNSSLKRAQVNNSTQYTGEDETMKNQRKRNEHKRQPSKVAISDNYINKSQPNNPLVHSSAQSLIQKIKEQQQKKPLTQQSQLLHYHQELIDKQYKKLIELQQQHYQTFKKKSSQDSRNSADNQQNNKPGGANEELSNQLMQYIKNQSQKKMKGYRSISNPDIGTQITKKFTMITSKAVLTQPGVLHTGQVKTNQDSYFIKDNLLNKPNCWILQVSDGHGTNGHFVAQFVREKLPQFIEFYLKQKKVNNNDFSTDESDRYNISLYQTSIVSTALKQAFERTTRELYSSGIDITFSGATTVVVVVFENETWCANIGDSRAVKIIQKLYLKILSRNLDRQTLQVIELSNDHKPDSPSEFKRILQNGGRIQPYSDQDGNPVGPARVWLKDENIPGLAMARSFGDYVAASVGVVSIPEIKKHSIRAQDKFIVIASDGIWEFLTNEWIVNTVNEYYLKNDIEGACQRLVDEAIVAWQKEDEVIDDITCIIVFIGQENNMETNSIKN